MALGLLSAARPVLPGPDTPPAPRDRPAAAEATAQSQTATVDTPAFPSRVELVTVDVVVVDGKGRAVPGLSQADFAVLENGRPQAIMRFEAVQLPAPTAMSPSGPRRRFSTNQSPEAQQGRTFVLVFDDVHLSVAQAQRAKAAIGEFLRSGVRPGDLVTLIATGGEAWWSARMPEGRETLVAILKRLDGRYVPDPSPDRITDWEALRIMAYDDPDVGYAVQRRFDSYGSVGRERSGDRQYADATRTASSVGLIDPYVRARAQDAYLKGLSRRRITVSVMTRALRALAETRGRKAMVLVSQGFVYEPDFVEIKQLVEASLRVNVPVYFIDTRGLQALPDFMTAEFKAGFDVQDTVAVLADMTREAEGSEAVALDTGGFVIRNTNDIEGGILRVSAESQAYYLLGYAPADASRDGKYRRIEVRLAGDKGKRLKVRARRGYYAPRDGALPAARPGTDPEIARALDSPFERREVPLRAAAYTFDETVSERSIVMVATEIDVHDLGFRQEDGRLKGELAFLLEVQHRETGEVYNDDQKIEMALLPETRESLARSWYLFTREMTLPKGGYQARVVVRDLGSGHIGSVIHDFEVPDPASFRVTSPILADTLEQKPSDSSRPPRPVLQVRRGFAPESRLYVQYSVVGAARDPKTRMPKVSGGYEIRRGDGSVLKAAAPTLIQPTSLGALIRLHGIALGGATPGDYELVLQVRDEIAGRTVEVREPFQVEAPATAAMAATPLHER
jgi:VWFA-related protein